MSASKIQWYLLDPDDRWWISAIASCARRFGRNPYEHGTKAASKMGSSTALRLAWTTRSATVGIPSLRSLPLAFGINRPSRPAVVGRVDGRARHRDLVDPDGMSPIEARSSRARAATTTSHICGLKM